MSSDDLKVLEQAYDNITAAHNRAVMYFGKLVGLAGPYKNETLEAQGVKSDIKHLLVWLEDLILWSLDDPSKMSHHHKCEQLLYQQELR